VVCICDYAQMQAPKLRQPAIWCTWFGVTSGRVSHLWLCANASAKFKAVSGLVHLDWGDFRAWFVSVMMMQKCRCSNKGRHDIDAHV